MIGIYKITNKINGHAYIGQSKDIDKRFYEHKRKAFRKNDKEYEKTLYRAFRKYGLENFIFEILEECEEIDLNGKEKMYIKKYNTFSNGYNETIGGDGVKGLSCERHPKTKLTSEDVYYIRECYNNHRQQKAIYQEFSSLIGESGFKKIWNGVTWKDIHMDVYTEENKKYFLYQRNSHSENNSHAKLKEQDIRNIRLRKKDGENSKEVWKDYSQITYPSFLNIWYYQNWKNIIV